MTRLWIGDFRIRPLIPPPPAEDETEAAAILEDLCEIEDAAECTWFKAMSAYLISETVDSDLTVIVTLGFNDCVNACIWNSLLIKDAVSAYVSTLTDLKNQFSNTNFYMCSVNPVYSDYPYKDKLISAKALNEKIADFNKKLKETCPVSYIDSYTYLQSTGFSTRDCVRYSADTWVDLYNFVLAHTTGTSSVDFKPRSNPPYYGESGDGDIDFALFEIHSPIIL